MSDEDKIKRAAIAGASYAIKFQERHPNATESEVMNHVSKNIGKIVNDIEENP